MYDKRFVQEALEKNLDFFQEIDSKFVTKENAF